MSDYIPTTEEVRNAWADDCNCSGHKEERALFDRWLADVKAQAWEEGFDAGEKDYAHHELTGDWDSDCTPNPYRQGENNE